MNLIDLAMRTPISARTRSGISSIDLEDSYRNGYGILLNPEKNGGWAENYRMRKEAATVELT
jgi:hypothetical protein